MATNRNLFFRAEQISPADLNRLNAQLDTDAFRAEVDAIRNRYYQRYINAGTGRARSNAERAAEKDEIEQLVLDAVGGSLPNGYNVSPDGYVQFANETPFLQKLAWSAAPLIGAQGVGMAANALGAAAGTGAVAPASASLPISTIGGAAPAAGVAAIPGTVAPAASGWTTLKSLLSSPEAAAGAKAFDWGVNYIGGRRAEDVLEADKRKADARHDDALALLASQRAEDLQLDADREAALQARWDARETMLEPYRVAGGESLARLRERQTPARDPYRSRFMT